MAELVDQRYARVLSADETRIRNAEAECRRSEIEAEWTAYRQEVFTRRCAVEAACEAFAPFVTAA